jgi:tellurite resistance protein TerC
MAVGIEHWIGFNLFLLLALALDLGVFHREAHAVRPREALTWSIIWIALALVFASGLWVLVSSRVALEFLTGYAVEKSLSVDNLFVMALVFSYFRIPATLQHRVLYWGIFGALIFRGIFIAIGAYALERWDWVIYLFGGILLYTGVRLALKDDDHPDLGANPVMRLAQRLLPLTHRFDGQHFWTVENGRRVATPLFLALLVVEASDIVFAVDSIPAIFAVTREPFLVYTANAFAILGLRALYFLLADLLPRFRYLRFGLAAILVFVGAKMVLIEVIHVHPAISLVVIVAMLGGAIWASVRADRRDARNHARNDALAETTREAEA